MAKLKPWYQVVTPREDLRENRPLDASEFAVHLDHIRLGRAHPDYIEPKRFFDRTFFTQSLLDLSSQVLRRLSGVTVETSAIFNMATQFGGGKTHALTALYHLAKGGDESKTWRGIDTILGKAQVTRVPTADVGVFVGTEFDVVTGRGGTGEPTRRTPWGELAWQIGGERSFAAVAKHDAEGIAPGGDVIRQMLPTGPILILMDELLNFVSRGRMSGQRDQLFNFLQNLSEEARARNNLVLCVSIPASELEMNPDDQRDLDSLKKMLDRTGKPIMMSAETEVAEIIRRRLFEWTGLPEDGRKTAQAYADWAMEHVHELSGFDAETAYERFRSAYPFHPSVLSVFERKWQSLPRFQRTRGVLRLLALWISRAYQEEHRQAAREPLITLGSAPLEDSTFRAAVFEQLGSDKLEVPVLTDITGRKESHAIRLDREASESIRKDRLHQKVATVIFFESNGGQTQAKAEASVPEIRSGVGHPDSILGEVDQVLEQLVGTCYYLSWERNRYRFSLSPNLNQMLVARRGNIAPKAIEKRIEDEVKGVFDAGKKTLEPRYFPLRSNDIPDRAELTLAVLGHDHPFNDPGTSPLMELIVREAGASARTFKSGLIFSVPDSTPTVSDTARTLLAWEEIEDDEETKQRLEDSQRKLLTHNLARVEKDLREAIWRSYRHIYLLGKDNKLKEIDLGQITSSMGTSLVDVILNELVRTDELTAGVGTNRLIKYWPPAFSEWSTKAVRDAFYSSPLLPRLLKGDSIKRTIADGVRDKSLGYARRDAKGNLILERFGESISENEIEIADDVFILRAEDALKLLEPPKLARLEIHPSHVSAKPGDKVSLTIRAFDQYGQPFPNSEVQWTETGGSIDKDGIYHAGADPGVFQVCARTAGIEAVTEVRLSTDASPPPPSERSDIHTIRWSGPIPPQKWMNFYTKVLSRFANTAGLRLHVHFEVPIEGEAGKAKAEETRAALKELGLPSEADGDVKSTNRKV